MIASKLLKVIVLIACGLSAAPVNTGWYYTITSPNGGDSLIVGPYNSELGCKDWLGSALFLHPFECHINPTPFNCRIIGNGYAYPASYAFPPPLQIPSGTCYRCAGKQCAVKEGWYGLSYPNGGGVKLLRRRKFKRSPDLKGSRTFFVGNTFE